MSWQILNGDCRDVLGTLPAASVHTCVTSPPYFGLRDYGHDGQIGLEPTPDEFVAALVGVFREVRRVLRDDGTVWLNLGDSYASGGGRSVGRNDSGKEIMGRAVSSKTGGATGKVTVAGCKDKDLVGIPWLVAFALRADGWYLRSEIIWHKPNPMPESVTDRPTKAHEQVFLLSKSPRYFYDADAVREEGSGLSGGGFSRATAEAQLGHGAMRLERPEVAGRNKRSVWTVATQPYAGAHFATFPPKLIEPCILAGCPERCCSECGAPWMRVVERMPVPASAGETKGAYSQEGNGVVSASSRGIGKSRQYYRELGMEGPPPPRTLGFEPSCAHNADATPGTVLDPFAGAGTTGMVALRHGRSFVGVELNAEYAAMARERIIADCPLHNHGLEVAA